MRAMVLAEPALVAEMQLHASVLCGASLISSSGSRTLSCRRPVQPPPPPWHRSRVVAAGQNNRTHNSCYHAPISLALVAMNETKII